MDEKTILAYQIRKLTLLLAGVLIVLSLIFKEASITGGIAIGALVSIIGFNMVVKMAYKINGPSAGRSARRELSAALYDLCADFRRQLLAGI